MKRRVGDLPEPGERVHGREVLVAISPSSSNTSSTSARPRGRRAGDRTRREHGRGAAATKNATRHSAVPSKTAVVAATMSGPNAKPTTPIAT